jgi:purine-binding chemotaxis protein CheW
VDEVSEVMDIGGDLIEPPPEFGTTVNTDFLMGIGKLEKKVVILLDIDKALTTNDIAVVAEVGVEA